MIVPTDHSILLRDLGSFAYASDTPTELAGKLQLLQGSAVDRVFHAAEMLYAFREQLTPAGLTLLGQLAGYALANGWQTPGDPTRIASIYNGVLRDVEGQSFPGLEDPAPVVAYRDDAADWRQKVQPNLDQLKTAKHNAINDLKNTKQDTPAPTPFGAVDNDDSSKIKINGAVTMAMLAVQQGQPFSVDWTMADNSVQTFNSTQMMQMGEAAGQYISQVHDHARDLKAQVDAVAIVDTGDPAADLQTAIAALDAIDITAGWPA